MHTVFASIFRRRVGRRLPNVLLWGCAAVACFANFGSANAETFSLDDITHWVGEGSNRAGLIIDWARGESEGNARAWGYRWEGQATGSQMLIDVLTADDRLFAKLGGEFFTFGLGYDANLETPFAIDDGSVFDHRGITQGDTGTSDGAQATDPLDQYGEGWFTQFWHYANAAGATIDTESWQSGQLGMFARQLNDGNWDAWTYTVPFDFGAFPDFPEITPTQLLGDYNRDGVVDAADYTVWRSSLGTTVATGSGADGNQNGVIDEADFLAWRSHYGQTSASPSQAITIPEPTTGATALLCCLLFSLRRFTNQPLFTPQD